MALIEANNAKPTKTTQKKYLPFDGCEIIYLIQICCGF
jgi:hypothetical protein